MENMTFEPFRLALGKVSYAPPIISEGLTIVLVLQGTMNVATGGNNYQLFSDDMLVINPLQQYQLTSSEKNLFLTVHISKKPIAFGLSEKWLPTVSCSSIHDRYEKKDKLCKLREALIHLMAVYFTKKQEQTLEVYHYLFKVVSLLEQFFKQDNYSAYTRCAESSNQWLSPLLVQIQTNYDQQFTLEKLAKINNISYSYLSRSFKKHVGMTFTDYVTSIRLSHALEDLLLTKQSIIKVAMNNGFANTKNFHHVFKKTYGLTPAKYRKKFALTQQVKSEKDPLVDYQTLENQTALQELAKYLTEKDIDSEMAMVQQEMSLALPKQKQTKYQSGKKIIRIGPASEGLSYGIKREIEILQQEIAFDFVHFEGFCEETNFIEEGLVVSEYLLNNQWFDFLVDIQLKPMIQFLLPKKEMTEEEIMRWCDKQLKILRHFLNRYGQNEVKEWYIQWGPEKGERCWKSESQFAYEYFYQKWKQLLPVCKIGIVGLCSLDKSEYAAYHYFITEQEEKGFLPEFICFQADPYVSVEIKNNYATRFKEYQKAIFKQVYNAIKTAQENGHIKWQPELFLTEWNTLVGEGNTLSGTFFRSALILEALIDLSEMVDGIAVWLNIKVKERQTHKREDSSLSVFLYGELRRPLFFSLQFLNHLNGELLAKGTGYILTRNQEQFQLLVYNSSYLDPASSINEFQVHYQTKEVSIHLQNIKEGKYLVHEYVLDKDHGGIYNDWIKVGTQVEIDFELQKYLEQKTLPKFELNKVGITSGVYTVNSTLTINACKLYVFQFLY